MTRFLNHTRLDNPDIWLCYCIERSKHDCVYSLIDEADWKSEGIMSAKDRHPYVLYGVLNLEGLSTGYCPNLRTFDVIGASTSKSELILQAAVRGITDLVVSPEFRHQGYGTKLLKAAFAACKGKVPSISVSCLNTPAMKLYTKLGFKPLHMSMVKLNSLSSAHTSHTKHQHLS